MKVKKRYPGDNELTTLWLRLVKICSAYKGSDKLLLLVYI